MKDEIALAVGARIRHIRKEHGLSQEELADQANLHRTYVGLVERGERNITVANIYKIAQALAVEPSELLPSLTSLKVARE